MSQCQRLLHRLKTGPINPMQAWQELGIYRLAARISDLKNDGHDIKKTMTVVINRYGEACKVASYSLNFRDEQ